MHPYTQYPDCPGCQPGPPIYAGDHSNGPAYSTNESTYNSYRYRNKRKAAELALEQRASRASNRRACGVNFPGSSSESSLNTIEISCEPFGGRFIDVGGDGMAPDWTQAPWRVASPGSGCRDNLQIIVVKRVEELAGALSHFKDTMTDPIVSIDLEWRPDSKYTDNNVALIQLSSQTVCLLLRCYQWRHARGYLLMPIVLHQFFKDPSNFFVACAWDNGDERKMQSTFGLGRRDLFSNFYDVQEISFELGYPENSGLSSLSRYVLHEFVPKFRSMSRTNWERNRLSEEQVDYAASDAYITGQLFRTFRYWKISSESCLQCKTVMGRQEACDQVNKYICATCNRIFKGWHSLSSHLSVSGHVSHCHQCTTCGRIHRVEPINYDYQRSAVIAPPQPQMNYNYQRSAEASFSTHHFSNTYHNACNYY